MDNSQILTPDSSVLWCQNFLPTKLTMLIVTTKKPCLVETCTIIKSKVKQKLRVSLLVQAHHLYHSILRDLGHSGA